MLKILTKLLQPAVTAAPATMPPDIELSLDDYSPEVVDAMAGDMTDQQGVWWAAKSARMVEDKLPAEEVAAIEAAEAWAKEPTPETQEAAADAAAATEFQGPGGWAAQAAGWAAMGSQAAGMGAAMAGAGGAAAVGTALTPHAVAGAVKLAAALSVDAPSVPDAPDIPDAPQLAAPDARQFPDVSQSEAPESQVPDPAQEQETAKALKPFIDLGHEIAEADQPWNQ